MSKHQQCSPKFAQSIKIIMQEVVKHFLMAKSWAVSWVFTTIFISYAKYWKIADVIVHVVRALARAFIGGGGGRGVFIHIFEILLKSVVIGVNFKRN